MAKLPSGQIGKGTEGFPSSPPVDFPTDAQPASPRKLSRESRARESHLRRWSVISDGNGGHCEEVSYLRRLPLPPQDRRELAAWQLAPAGGGDEDQDPRTSCLAS